MTAQMSGRSSAVERNLAKVDVESSILFARSKHSQSVLVFIPYKSKSVFPLSLAMVFASIKSAFRGIVQSGLYWGIHELEKWS